MICGARGTARRAGSESWPKNRKDQTEITECLFLVDFGLGMGGGRRIGGRPFGIFQQLRGSNKVICYIPVARTAQFVTPGTLCGLVPGPALQVTAERKRSKPGSCRPRLRRGRRGHGFDCSLILVIPTIEARNYKETFGTFSWPAKRD